MILKSVDFSYHFSHTAVFTPKMKRKAAMAVHVISCYFLPFLFFFLAQIAFPKSIVACTLGISALSISCLVLYFKIIDIKKPALSIQQQTDRETKCEPTAAIPEQAVKIAVAAPKVTYEARLPILDFAKNALGCTPKLHIPNTKAIIAEQQQALASQKSLFTEELEKRTHALSELQEALNQMQQALQAKESELHNQTKEIEDLKFELYTLLRIESYVSPHKEQESNKLAAASF